MAASTERSPSGTAVTNLRLASNRSFTSNGERRDEALFVDVEVYGKPGEALAQHKAKGDFLLSAPANGAIGTAPVPLALQQVKIAPGLVTPNGDGRGDQATITYKLSSPALVTVGVLDGSGTEVATLFSRRQRAGKNETPDVGSRARADGGAVRKESNVGDH